MKECEVKILEIDKEAVSRKLKDFGAEETFSGEMDIFYFDYEDERIKKAGELLRMRKIGEKVELVYKKNRREEKGCKVLDEHQVTVSNFDEMKVILESAGLSVRKNYKKTRTEFKKDGLTFVIDEHPEIPTFLEIEAGCDDIEEWIEKLELKDHERSAKTFGELLKYYR